MYRSLLAAALMAITATAHAKAPAAPKSPAAMSKPAPHAFTVDDMVRLERVSDPDASADGKWVVYGLRTPDLAANKFEKSLWVVPTDGSAAPRWIAKKGGATDGRFGKDGHVYFLSPRSGSNQVWRTPVDGGPSVQVTDLPLDVEAFALSPTGDKIAVAMKVFVDAKTLDESQQRFAARAADPDAPFVYDRPFFRHWDTWEDGSKNQLFTLVLNNGKAVGTPAWVSRGTDGDAPSKPFGGADEFSFSPDGKHLYFTLRTAGTTESWSTNTDIWRVESDGSHAPQNLTLNNLAADTGPVLSPDGKTLAYRAMKRPMFEADRYAIMLRDLVTNQERELAPTWDRSANSLVWSADSKTLYTHADELGQTKLFAVAVDTGAVQTLTQDGTVEGFAVTSKGIVIAHNSLAGPTQLLRLDPTGPKALTQHNAESTARFSTGAFEQFSFAGWNHETVYGYVVKPANYQPGKKYPVAFIVHGGPQGSMGNHWHYRWNPQTYAGKGYAVVFIDFHGSTGYGQAFTDSISGDWGGKPLEDLQKGWAHALKTYDFLDGTRAAALGASYGGYMMNWIATRWPNAFKAIVNHCGIFDNRSMYYTTEELWFDEWEHQGTPWDKPEAFEKHNPVNYLKDWVTPTLIIHGEKDFRVPIGQGYGAANFLSRKGIPFKFAVFPTSNHWVLKPRTSQQWHALVEDWLAIHLQ